MPKLSVRTMRLSDNSWDWLCSRRDRYGSHEASVSALATSFPSTPPETEEGLVAMPVRPVPVIYPGDRPAADPPPAADAFPIIDLRQTLAEIFKDDVVAEPLSFTIEDEGRIMVERTRNAAPPKWGGPLEKPSAKRNR